MDRLAPAAHAAMQEYYQRCREAELFRAEEQQAAVVLQAAWRGCLQRHEVDCLRRRAITIQKCWRGYLGRRRFAAALAAHNTQLCQAYFDQQATVIQKCWRGHFSRTRIHDFYKRQAFLQSVAAANAAVRADMQAELQAALTHKQQQAQAAAKQNFEAQVNKLHYLSSTASIPGIFSTPAATAGQLRAGGYTVAGQPIEHHLRTAVRQKAAVAVKQQQLTLKRALGNTQQGSGIFPAGVPPSSSCGGPPGAGQQAAQLPALQLAAAGTGAAACSCASAAPADTCCTTTTSTTFSRGGTAGSRPAHASNSSSRGSSRSSQKLPPLEQKLAHRIVEAFVDQVYATKADPNMPDGSFNPALSLQQAADFEASREAADLDRRLERGLMLVLHKGQPFIPITSKQDVFSVEAPQQAAANDQHAVSEQLAASGSSSGPAVSQQGSRGCSPDGNTEQLWRHNKHSGGMFSRHLKQVY